MIQIPQSPPISKELITFLEGIVPSKTFRPTDDLSSIMHYSGKRDLIDMLRVRHEEQQKNVPQQLPLRSTD